MQGAKTLLNLTNRVKDGLAQSARPKLYRIHRIGWALDFTLQNVITHTSGFITGGTTEQAMNGFVSVTKTFRQTLPEDIKESGLPENIKNAIHKTDLAVRSVEEIKKVAEACREVLRLLE